jgi:hypothetical protein
MLDTSWDAMDAVLLSAAAEPINLAELVAASGFPRDVVAGLVDGYLASRYLTQPLPGFDQYQLTLSGRTYLSRLTAAPAADTRKAA